MAVNYYFGWTESDLLTALRSAQEDIAKGSMLASAGAGEVNASRVIQYTPVRRVQMIAQALCRLDPVKYEDLQNSNVTQTTARFGDV